MKTVGIMSGTSVDGVDFVLCDITKSPFKMKLIDSVHKKFSSKIIEPLKAATRHELKVDALATLHHELGRFYAKELRSIAKSRKWKIELIGCHGQTVFHDAPNTTLQIGEAAYLRAEFGVPVVSDFRSHDLALGGQGAPIATLFHQKVLAPLAGLKATKTVAVQNLGGIANVSYFSKNKNLSFDTGPANMLMDLAASEFLKTEFDINGKAASKGIPIPGLVQEWLKHAYFSKKPPKSCGREEFGEVFYKKIKDAFKDETPEDILATLTEFTARSIAHAYTNHLPSLPAVAVLCGGGSKNANLKARLQYCLPKTLITTSDDLDWPSDTVEGAAFALLAAFRFWNLPSNLPKTTGAKKEISMGKIS